MLLDGPMHGIAFVAYVEKILLPELRVIPPKIRGVQK
jgi:hypothetical protein